MAANDGARRWCPPAVAVAAALLLYGGLSVPAPPALRAVEATIGLLLVAAVGWRWPLTVTVGQALRAPGGPEGRTMAVAALGWLLWVPLLRGTALGWEAADILRDVVPLLYLFLPLLLLPALRRAGPFAARVLAAALALAGLLLVVRWWRQAQWDFAAVGARAMADGSAYLLNAPAVLFAAVALPAFGLSLIGTSVGRSMGHRSGRWLALLHRSAVLGGAFGCMLGGMLCLGALAGAVHRTALGLAGVALAAIALWWTRRRPGLALPVLLLAGIAAVLAGDMLAGAWGQAAEKTRLTGINARFEEAAAVVGHITASPWTLLFGDGWGARIANPAVGGWRVGYTHTLASYCLLKTGILGTLMLVGYLGSQLRVWLRLLAADPPLALAVMPPLLMALCLHTSFKYLDTGALLSLTLLAGGCRKGLSRG